MKTDLSKSGYGLEPVELTETTEEEDDKPSSTKTKSNGLISTIKSHLIETFLTTDNLRKLVAYEFRFPHHEARQLFMDLITEHEIKLFDTNCIVESVYDFSSEIGQRLAIIEGVLFLVVVLDDHRDRGMIKVYVPTWQRGKAKRVIKDELLKRRPRCQHIHFNRRSSTESYDPILAEQKQFVRDDVYDYLSRIFERVNNNSEWYKTKGKAHKETILLHGKPGTGKTSLFMHFAAKYKSNVYQLSPRGFVNDLYGLLEYANKDTRSPLFVLIEDIDSYEELLLPEFRTSFNDGSVVLEGDEFNYSSFINALDGSRRLNNMVVCLSTNYKHKLMPSIYRQGRVDHQLDVTPLTSAEIAAHVNTEHSEYIASLPDDTFAIANIIDLQHCKTVKEIDELAKWVKE